MRVKQLSVAPSLMIWMPGKLYHWLATKMDFGGFPAEKETFRLLQPIDMKPVTYFVNLRPFAG